MIKEKIKNTLTTLLIITLIFVFHGCKKGSFDLFDDFSDYLPEVKTLTAELIGKDSILLIGEVTYQGASPVEFTGFCFNNDSLPEMMENQILSNMQGSRFYAIVKDIDAKQIYYFRTFAANDWGYVYGNILRYEVPDLTPPYVPCTINDNILVHNGTTYQINNVTTGSGQTPKGEYRIRASSYPGPSIEIEFIEIPRNGIYTTAIYDQFNAKDEVYITMKDGMLDFSAKAGSKLYVVMDTTGGFAVTICDLTTLYNQSEYKAKTKIIVD